MLLQSISNSPSWPKKSKNVIIFQMQRAVLTLSGVKVQRAVFRLYRGKKIKLLRFSWKWQQIVRLPQGIQKKNSLHYLWCLRHLFLDQNVTGQHSAYTVTWQLTFIASYLGNLTFPKVQTILFLNTLSQTNNLLPFSCKSVLLYFFNPVQFEYLPLTFKAT